jgi:hypothetical protein
MCAALSTAAATVTHRLNRLPPTQRVPPRPGGIPRHPASPPGTPHPFGSPEDQAFMCAQLTKVERAQRKLIIRISYVPASDARIAPRIWARFDRWPSSAARAVPRTGRPLGSAKTVGPHSSRAVLPAAPLSGTTNVSVATAATRSISMKKRVSAVGTSLRSFGRRPWLPFIDRSASQNTDGTGHGSPSRSSLSKDTWLRALKGYTSRSSEFRWLSRIIIAAR